MRSLFLAILLLVLVFIGPAFSQQRWERTYGGAGADGGESVQQTTDTGYIVAGWTNSFGDSTQVYLIKTNASGDTLWTKTYGGTRDDWGYSVQQTSDTGYIVAGYTYSFGNGDQVYLIKTNPSGDTLWTKTYGGTNSDEGYSVQQTTDGGYVVAGTTNSFGNGAQVYLVKTNASGDTLWTKTYGGAGADGGYSVQQTTDTDYIVAGYTYSNGPGWQVYLIKTNVSGDTLWTRSFGGTSYDYGSSVQQTTDGGYIVAGYTYSFGYGWQVYLIKTNALGDTLWTRTYGGANSEEGYSVRQTTDGGYIIAGVSDSFGGGSYDVYLIKTNPSGDTLWTKTYEGTDEDWGKSVQQTTDGGYVVAGNTYSNGPGWQVSLIKTDANGNVGVETPVRQLDGSTVRQLKATPNPFTSFATLPGHSSNLFTLYDISGRKVGTYKGDRIGEGLRAGVYFVKPEGRDAKPLRIVKLR